MTLSDATGQITARLFNRSPKDLETLTTGTIIGIDGVVQEFGGTMSIKIDRYKVLADYKPEDFMMRTPYDALDMWQRILEMLKRIKHPGLKALVKAILEDEEIMRRIRIWGAAKKRHHSYAQGWVEHTYRVMADCEHSVRLYPHVDYDLMIVAAFVHDLGKLYGYTEPPAIEYAEEEELVGHIVIGCLMVHDAAKRVGLDESLTRQLLHCIVSHHGRPEWGSPKPPLTPEAKILHEADRKDSQLGHDEMIRRQNPGRTGKLSSEVYVPEPREIHRPDPEQVLIRTHEG